MVEDLLPMFLRRLRHKYPVISEFRRLLSERKVLYEDAVKKFAEEKPCNGSLRDYKKALRKHRVTYREYMHGYEFWRLDEKQRGEFISQREMMCIYRKAVHEKVKSCFIDKKAFLTAYSEFVHRKWLDVTRSSTVPYKEFFGFVSSFECVAKPVAGSQGKGIFVIDHPDEKEALRLWQFCRENDYLVEERVAECQELAEYHPQSLNTIRIVTMSGKGECVFVGALLRMGVNDSFIDNTHSGGIFVPIDIKTGIALMDGIDIQGNTYKVHPNSGKEIKGFKIPHWEECLEVCRNATRVIPDVRFAGWDICILPDGGIELIEGNAAPNVDGGLQAPLKKGIKSKIQAEGKRLFGFDPISLVSLWSRCKKS